MKLKLGDVVIFRHTVDGRGTEIINDYPAIIYKKFDESEAGDPLGLMVLVEGTPCRYGKVMHSEKPLGGTWRYRE